MEQEPVLAAEVLEQSGQQILQVEMELALVAAEADALVLLEMDPLQQARLVEQEARRMAELEGLVLQVRVLMEILEEHPAAEAADLFSRERRVVETDRSD